MLGDWCSNLSGVIFSPAFMLYVHIRIIMPEFTYLQQHTNKKTMLNQDKVENRRTE